jgi:transcription antitermination protein NusB
LQQSAPPVRTRSGGRSARRRSRELALQGLYEWLISGHGVASIETQALEDPSTARAVDRAHYRELLHGTIDHAEDLRARFAPHLDRSVAALSPVEHAILLIGTYELNHRPEIPYRVVINEAVELAKGFGGTEGFRYVNGVLDKVAAELRAAEVTGRG